MARHYICTPSLCRRQGEGWGGVLCAVDPAVFQPDWIAGQAPAEHGSALPGAVLVSADKHLRADEGSIQVWSLLRASACHCATFTTWGYAASCCWPRRWRRNPCPLTRRSNGVPTLRPTSKHRRRRKKPLSVRNHRRARARWQTRRARHRAVALAGRVVRHQVAWAAARRARVRVARADLAGRVAPVARQQRSAPGVHRLRPCCARKWLSPHRWKTA